MRAYAGMRRRCRDTYSWIDDSAIFQACTRPLIAVVNAYPRSSPAWSIASTDLVQSPSLRAASAVEMYTSCMGSFPPLLVLAVSLALEAARRTVGELGIAIHPKVVLGRPEREAGPGRSRGQPSSSGLEEGDRVSDEGVHDAAVLER